MFGTLGGPEIIFILVIALIVFGPRKLPEMGKSLGKMMAEFRKASADFKRTVEDEVEAEKYSQASLPAAAAVVPADGMPVAPLDPAPEPELTTHPPDTPTVAREEHAGEPAAETPAAETEAVKQA
jgi:TatA/E family protein of Tat protein translocase